MAGRKSDVLSLRLDSDLLSGLDVLAEKTRRPRTFLVEDAIAQYLDANAWQVEEIEQAVAEADAGDFASPEDVEALTDRYKPARP